MKIAIQSLLAITICLALSATTSADARVTVHEFYGPNARRIESDVISLLQSQAEVKVVPKADIDSAAKSLGVDSYSTDGRQRLARQLQLSAWLTGMVQRRHGKLSLTVTIYDGAQHARIGRAEFMAKSIAGLSAKLRGRLWRRSGRAILHAEAPAPQAGTALAAAGAQAGAATNLGAGQREVDQASEQPSIDGSAAGSRDVLRAFVGIGSPFRSLSYRQPVSATLGDYRLSGAPMADVRLAFYPGRLASDGWLSWLGVEGRGQLTISSPTLDREGKSFKSRYDSLYVGARVRVPVGAHHVSVFSGYALSRFAVTAQDGGAPSPTPSVDYRSIRSGMGGELQLSNAISVAADAAWLHFLSVGEIGQWFPRASAAGVELALSGSYRVSSGVFTRVAAVYQRSFFDFHSRPEDTNIAGGAIDQSLALSLGLGMAL